MLLKIICLSLLLVLAGCMQITSSPSGANLFIAGNKVGQTPFDTGEDESDFYGRGQEVWVGLPGHVIDSVRIDDQNLHFMLRSPAAPAKEATESRK